MKVEATCISTLAIVLAAYVASYSVAGAAHEQQRQPVPPPAPAAIYDPQAGPFIVHLNGDGGIEKSQYAVVNNAVLNRSGQSLQAFTICFRSQHQPIDWKAANNALRTVAGELKLRKAKAVVMPSGSLCASISPDPAFIGSEVEIMGVIQF